MENKLSCILGRRSIRKFKDTAIDTSLLQMLLECAMAAPSAVAKDPWRFIVVTGQKTRDSIADGLPNGQMLRQAPAAIVVCGDSQAVHDRLEGYLVQDCSAATENILLAAHALGLGSCWLGVHPRGERMEHIRKLFSLPTQVIPVSVIALGFPAEQKEPRTRFKAEYVHYEKW